MNAQTDHQAADRHVIVIASSIEGIDALARLVNELPGNFSVPVVAHLHGLRNDSIDRLTDKNLRFPSRPSVVYARKGEKILGGHVYILPADDRLVFSAPGILDQSVSAAKWSVDHLFQSAAQWYQSGVIGVVLSGLGTEGTSGLRAITRTNGIRVVQSPYDTNFPGMPANALIGDDVQYSVMLDQMGPLLQKIVSYLKTSQTNFSEISAGVENRTSDGKSYLSEPLDRNILGILNVVRQELSMDIAFVTKLKGDNVMIDHSTINSSEFTLQGVSFSKEQSLCQRVLDGRLPAVMPDVKALRLTHDMPDISVAIGAYMAAPVQLQDGRLYGTLCCLNLAVSPELGKLQYERLQMSARQIARLVDENEEK